MRVAALERFAQPSRRCEASRIAGPGDDVVAWDLRRVYEGGRRARLRHILALLVRWLVCPVPLGQRGKLLRACLRTGGARLGALEQAPDLWRRVSKGEVDRIACFSAKDFALAKMLTEGTRAPCEEVIARGTQYFGEFAFELLAVIPYAYWLHRQGRLEFTVSTEDTGSLYYFSSNHEERSVPRRYVPVTEYPLWPAGRLRWDRPAFPSVLDTHQWVPPPYKDVYRTDRFRWSREVCVVCNKASDERYLGRGFAVNFMDTELLLSVIGRLRTRYQVVYNRPRATDIVNDRQVIRELGDIEAVKREFPDVLTIQELQAAHPDLGFNELQLRLYAACQRFVSVLGGSSYLASYFGGTNVVYARMGREVSSGAFEGWFDRFSGARVVPAATPYDLLTAIERELL